MPDFSYQFTHAITRKPSASVVNGLRGVDTGAPDFAQLQADHADYVARLKQAGATVVELPALADYPDAIFVEDTALCLPHGAVLLRPGAESRQGEVAHIEAALVALYEADGDRRVLSIAEQNPQARIEGGDILTTNKEIMVGLSARTNHAGVEALRALVSPWAYRVREVKTPEGVLHFKTHCSLLSASTVLATQVLADSGCFADYRVLLVPTGEENAANVVRFNDSLMMPANYPKTASLLREHGYKVVEINNSECEKIDGGMSCLSLRFSV